MEKLRLRVLIANQKEERLDLLTEVVTGLGHKVIAREIHVSEASALTAQERPDVALVGLGESSEHALEMITEIVKGSFCPVIALLQDYDGEWIDKAACRGVYAYIVDTRPEELQSALDITLRRFAECQDAVGAFDKHKREMLARQRQLLELHDGVVQKLTVAQLSLDLDRADDTREALLGALENARSVVSRSIDELRGEGIPLDELLSDAAPLSL